MRGASPDEAHPGLHSKPLDVAIEQVLAHIAAAAAMVDKFGWKHTTLKKLFLAS
jgi:hypothetical protein